MDWQTILNFCLGAAVAAFGWFARELWGAVKELRADVRALEVKLPTHYVHKDEFRTELSEIKAMLHKISDKLDAKADKP